MKREREHYTKELVFELIKYERIEKYHKMSFLHIPFHGGK